MRAICQLARGHRSSARFSFHDARCSGASSRSTLAAYGSSVVAAPGEQVADRVGGEVGRDEALVHAVARHRVDQPGRVADEERPLAGDLRAGPAQRQAVAAELLEPLRLEPVRLADAAQVLAEPRPLLLPRRRRRRWRGRPSGRPSRSRRGCRRARPRRGARSARARASAYGDVPLVARRRARSRRRAPSAFAVVPFAPSAPTTTSAATGSPPDLDHAVVRSTCAPSRTSAPRSRAASSRNASSRRRCVIQITGSAALRSTAVAVAEAQLDQVDALLDHRRRVDRAAA